MESFTHFIRDSLRTNFGPTVFLFVSALIAAVFIGYLIVDAIRNSLANARRKRHLREEHRSSSH